MTGQRRAGTTARTARPAPGQARQGGPPEREPRAAGAASQHDLVRADRVCLGWQYALREADPGPAPRRPAPPASVQLDQGWAAAQEREESLLSRPARTGRGAAVIAAAAIAALGGAGLLNPWLTGLGLAVSVPAGAAAWRAVRRGTRDLRARIEAEQARLAKIRAVQQGRLAARQEQHASQFRAWQERQAAFERQPQWYAVTLPAGIDRIDVAGGTLAGWSALLTTIALPRLSSGGEVTVLDLTEGGVGTDLIAVARQSGISPLVWVLPADMPRLDLGAGLGREALADLLAAAAASGEPGAEADLAKDTAILDRVLGVLRAEPAIAQVTAALRALGQIGDPRADLRGGLLTGPQLEQLGTLFGRGVADRVVIERAWALEARLRKLEQLGSAAVTLPRSRLRVAWLDRRSGAVGSKVLGTYLTVALAHMLRQAPAASPARRWQRTVCLLGAERLTGDVIDRITDACELSGTGLVLAYRSVPDPVAQRLGRGNAAVAFMRLGNARDAKVASEQIGTEHRFVLSQFTETVGSAVSDTAGDSYTSTTGTADSLADSVSVTETAGRSRSKGRSRPGGFAPFGDFTGQVSRDASYSSGTSGSRSISAGISSSTSWGLSTSQAVTANTALTRTGQRSREFLVEPHELQQLPPSAVIVAATPGGQRRVVLADANPGIFALRPVTLLGLDDEAAGPASAARPGLPGRAADLAAPNLGPPPERLDWRTPRR